MSREGEVVGSMPFASIYSFAGQSAMLRDLRYETI